MLNIKIKSQKYLPMLLAALISLVPMACHSRTVGQIPIDTPANTPKIVFESLEHDFGTEQPNKPLSHSFVFKNKGTAELMIEKVKAG
jgi:hypothetical protein